MPLMLMLSLMPLTPMPMIFCRYFHERLTLFWRLR